MAKLIYFMPTSLDGFIAVLRMDGSIFAITRGPEEG